MIRAEFAEWTTDGLLRQAAFKGIERRPQGSRSGRARGGPGDGARALGRARSGRARPRDRRRDIGRTPRPPPSWPPSTPWSETGRGRSAGHEVRLTNLDKVLFPASRPDDPALTKRDLIRHYVSIGPILVPAPRGTAA